MESLTEISKISIEKILEMKVSFQESAFADLGNEISIKQVLQQIKNGAYQPQINLLRNLLNSGDKDGYDGHKKKLAGVTFCGTFIQARRKSNLKDYNRLVVLDIDKLSDEELQLVKDSFSADKFVFAFWESPSKKGIKGLVHLSFNIEWETNNIDTAHKAAFAKLKTYFADNYKVELDASGSDTTRLCFLSYDPNAVTKNEVASFEISADDLLIVPVKKERAVTAKIIHKSSRDAMFNPKGKNEPSDRKTMQSIIKYLAKRNISITSSYDEWFRVAFAIANTFTYEIGEKYFLQLSKIDSDKFNESRCKNFLLSCYESNRGEIGFNKIKAYAIEKGYITKRIREGSSEPVLAKAISEVSTSLNGSLPEELKVD